MKSKNIKSKKKIAVASYRKGVAQGWLENTGWHRYLLSKGVLKDAPSITDLMEMKRLLHYRDDSEGITIKYKHEA